MTLAPRENTKAQFWKCALQVNPSGYIKYRGQDHGMSDAEYNAALLKIALENDIKVIGLADHGNVDSCQPIRDLMAQNGIIVFPGFEISTSEKIHFVCLFSEDTNKTTLDRYLGSLDLLDPADGVRPSRLSAEQLLKKVEDDLGGFVYAAHCTDENGVLLRKSNHVWKSSLLKAAQIPATLDDLKNDDGNAYRQILLNKDPAYAKETPIAIINAKDVAKPDDLANPRASCLIKMTHPSFESFKRAFHDPESRVRLNSDVSEKYFSRIESLKITGGYLDGVSIDFSEHLNTVIGGRGTGKSTLVECIRYALERRPIGKNAQKQHDDIIKENIGKSRARIELTIRSSKMNGKKFTISRRYGESTLVKDDAGAPSAFSPADLLPNIEIYGQNEIYEIAQDPTNQRQLLARFLDIGHKESEQKIFEALNSLSDNRKKLIEAQTTVASIEDETARLPKLEERVLQFKNLGLEEKLKIIPLLETEKRLLKRAMGDEVNEIARAFGLIKDSLPDVTFLSDTTIAALPHAEQFKKLREGLSDLSKEAVAVLDKWSKAYQGFETKIKVVEAEIKSKIEGEETILEKTFKELPTCEGKTGREIGVEFQNLIKEIEQIKPKKTLIENRRKIVTELQRVRKLVLDELSSARADRSAYFVKSLKKLNSDLTGKLKLTVKPEADRTPVISFLLNCRMDGIGEGRLAWVKEAEDFSPVKLAEKAREGTESLRREKKWGITPTMAEALARLSPEQLLELEEIELPDEIYIELNTAHQGSENFRPLNKLSTGQQCTAILHLLLLKNADPLLMDQPEDNLDNAFIADRIVSELRLAKIKRQFIFATHNANIPVFGDAEWIGVFEAFEGQAHMPIESQGAIDVTTIRDKAANILEGGRAAFNQRKEKYGF
jgi:ABC-type lipoprotein export system ATPase subunit